MKKLNLFLLIVLVCSTLQAQVSKTINMSTAGTLSSLLTAAEKSTITNLTVTGNINDLDIKCMRDEISLLATIDMTDTSLPNNQFPINAFYNTFTSKGKSTLVNVKLPIGITSIGESAFKNCLNLSIISIPNSVIEISNLVFLYCEKLTDIIIPNSTISIGYMAFYNCTKLQNITLGSSVNSIGMFAFGGYNENIKTIFSLNTKPPTLSTEAFANSQTVTDVFVPNSAISAYKSAPGWSDYFGSVIKGAESSNTFNIVFQIGVGGTLKENNNVVSDGSSIIVNSGESKTFTITPIVGYEIATLTYNGLDEMSDIVNSQYTTPVANANSTLNITFKKIKYQLGIKDAEKGTINLFCEYGSTPSFNFTPSLGWNVSTIFYNNVDVTSSLVNGVYTVPAITANGLLNVTFVSTSVGVPEFVNNRLKVFSTQSQIIIEGTTSGEKIEIYTLDGKLIDSQKSEGERMVIPAKTDAVYLIKTSGKTYKVRV